jgi:hypothetical protein
MGGGGFDADLDRKRFPRPHAYTWNTVRYAHIIAVLRWNF